jgi:MFS family permease
MYQNLENYLQEISHYLAVKDSSSDILSEIRSHILEKTEEKFGKLTEEGVAKIIFTYGRPQQVAAKYIEDVEIISPTLKRHLFLYTGILFLFHSVMSIFAYLTNISMLSFPFLYIPQMDGWQITFYLPMAFVYDLGLVVFFLYLITQRKKETRLPWPKLFSLQTSKTELKRPKIVFLIFRILVFSSFLYLFIQHGAIFFASMNDPNNPIPLMDPSALSYYSILFLTIIGCEVIGYAVRFINRSRWLDLINTSVVLFLLQFVWNSPVKADFAKIQELDLKNIAFIFILFVTVVAVFRFLRSLILFITNSSAKYNRLAGRD